MHPQKKKSISVPFNDTSRTFEANRNRLLNSLTNTAKSGWWLMGKNTKKFSHDFANYCGTEYCLPVANGTDALELALRAVLDPEQPANEQEVVTVANAGGYTTTICRIIGVTPVYVDIDENSQLIDINSLIRSLSPSVRAIVITHLYGAAVNIKHINRALKENGYNHLPIIEDCAQAHGAKIGQQRVGSLGTLAAFSFYPTKNLGAMGDAGAVVTSDRTLYKTLKALHQYGWDKKYHVSIPFGKNSRMDEVQAGILTQLLPQLDEYNLKRTAIWSRYSNQLYNSSNNPKASFLTYKNTDFVGHLAVLKVPERESFIHFMRSKNIAVDIHYPVLDCDQEAWKNLPMRIDEEGGLKVSRKSVSEIVSVPCFPLMQETEISHVCSALDEWVSV